MRGRRHGDKRVRRKEGGGKVGRGSQEKDRKAKK